MPVKKTTVKAESEKTAAVKTTPVKTEEPKAETTTTTTKKATVKRGAAKKEAAAKKETAAKAAVKNEIKETVYVQFAGAEYNLDEVKENIKKAWMAETGKKASDIKEVQIYVKPEENAAYYVVNGEIVEGGSKIEL